MHLGGRSRRPCARFPQPRDAAIFDCHSRQKVSIGIPGVGERELRPNAIIPSEKIMCGIAGFLDTTQSLGNEKLTAIVSAMADTLHHRGPDAQGSWVDERVGVALGHRRLSILDLSHEGDQPMLSSAQR